MFEVIAQLTVVCIPKQPMQRRTDRHLLLLHSMPLAAAVLEEHRTRRSLAIRVLRKCKAADGSGDAHS